MNINITNKREKDTSWGKSLQFQFDLGNFVLITSVLKFTEPRKFNETSKNVKVGIVYAYLNDKQRTNDDNEFGDYLFFIKDINIIKLANGDIFLNYPSYQKKDTKEWINQFMFSKDFERKIIEIYKNI